MPKKIWASKIIKLVYPFIIALIYCLFAVFSLNDYSPTTDEPSHLIRGRLFLETGDYRMNQHNPMLYNAIQALPTFLEKKVIMEDRDNNEYWNTADKNKMKSHWVDINGGSREFGQNVLLYPRLAAIVFTSICMIVFYFIILKLFSPTAAIVATTLFSFSTAVMAHSRLVTTDFPVIIFIFFTTVALHLYSKAHITKKKHLWFAAFIALSTFALQIKYTTVLVSIAWIGILFLIDWKTAKGPNVKRAFKSMLKPLAVIAIWVLSLTAIYGFQFGTLQDMTYGAAWRDKDNRKSLTDIASGVNKVTPWDNTNMFISFYEKAKLPFPQYANGFLENVVFHNFFWYGTTVLGKFYGPNQPMPLYYPLVFLSKESIPFVLIAVTLPFFLIFKSRKVVLNFIKENYVLALMAGFIVFMLSIASIRLGIRHLLPLYPFMAMFIGIAISHVTKQKLYLRIGLIVFILGGSLVGLINGFPDYISHFNEFVGSTQRGVQIVNVSGDVHWGQNDAKVEDYIQDHNAITDIKDLTTEEKSILILGISKLYGTSDSKEIDELRKKYESREIIPIDYIGTTHIVFEVDKDDVE